MTVQTRFVQCFVPEFIRAGAASIVADSKFNHKKLGMESNKKLFKGEIMINDEIGMRILSGKVIKLRLLSR